MDSPSNYYVDHSAHSTATCLTCSSELTEVEEGDGQDSSENNLVIWTDETGWPS